MAKTDSHRKGILFTLSAMLLASSLLAFALFLSEQSAKATHSAVSILEIDRAAYTYANVEYQLARIISGSSSASVSNGTALFTESLPYKASIAQDLDRFSQFESEQSDLNVSMNLTNLKNGTLLIMPVNARVWHGADTFGITPISSPESSGLLERYEINVTFPPASADAVAWEAQSNATGPNAMAVRIRVMNSDFSFVSDYEGSLDKNAESRLNITQGGALVGYVRFAPPASVEIFHSGNIGLKASVGFSTQVYVEANDTISVISASNKTGKVRIA